MQEAVYLAHSKNDQGRGVPERLAEHLTRVAERAAEYAAVFGAEQEARIAGLLHDLGKYSPRFLSRLRGEERGLDHWTPGAILARKKYGVSGTAASVAILGHHVGLDHAAASLVEELKSLARNPPSNLTVTDPTALLEHLDRDGLTIPERPACSVYSASAPSISGMLDIRMLFSSLVDADYVETEAHFDGTAEQPRRYRPDGPTLEAARALEVLLGYVDQLSRESKREGRASENTLALRSDLLRACLDGADQAPGLFTLSAPTGAGKTLAMLAFALRHAGQARSLRRIVVVIPYLSIIEQTAREYRKVLEPHFGKHFVLEDHSLAGIKSARRGAAPGDADEQHETARLLAENWDAPLVITTSVQFLESLFANRPGACRKLHNLAESVILFDEVQTLPPALAVPTLAALSHLAERYGSTVVFSTATQPAFDHLHPAVAAHCGIGWQPREVVPPQLGLFKRTRRTRIEWALESHQRVTWEQLANELAAGENSRVLCVVNLKRHAKALVELLVARGLEVFHLSTNMCPAHRKRVLDQVRDRLQPHSPRPCCVVSTQCVEAGVDLDFPRVYRALAPLDSITQAAGRCNRNDNLVSAGVVRVFVPQDEGYPPGWYQVATGVTRSYLESLHSRSGNLDQLAVTDDPDLLCEYYRALYDLGNVAAMEDPRGRGLQDAFTRRSFLDVAKLYRLIPQDTIELLVPYDETAYRELRREVEKNGRLTSDWVHRARYHAIGLFRPRLEDDSGVWNVLVPVAHDWRRAPDRLTADWFILAGPNPLDLYDQTTGLRDLRNQWIS